MEESYTSSMDICLDIHLKNLMQTIALCKSFESAERSLFLHVMTSWQPYVMTHVREKIRLN